MPTNYNRFSDRAIYWSKIVMFSYPLAFDAPVRGGEFPSEYLHPEWCGETRMVWLPDAEKISKISLFVLAQLTNVTDRRTDGQTPHAGNSRAYASHRAATRMVGLPDGEKTSRICIMYNRLDRIPVCGQTDRHLATG